ncbi:MAG: ATP-binding protein [Bifidobacteriaceae bacterium]|jgi:predicted AAA+ superfamily ATPase|nr:ATP-binding protein [Bifidobacteriaceae bacterium]
MPDPNLFPRFALGAVRGALADTPAVAIQGARQVGKSTLAAVVAADSKASVVTLDNPAALAVAREDPMAIIGQSAGLAVIDEAQRAPGLILPLKASIDADRRPGRFLLTGSADLLNVKGVGDSLAGRIETVELMPLSQGELERRVEPEDFVTWLAALTAASALGAEPAVGQFGALDPAAVFRGGLPEPAQRTELRARRWFTSYVARLAGHDARELAHGGYADRLRALLGQIAGRGLSELVKARVARDLDVAESTADGYLRLARDMRLMIEFPAWNRAPMKRLTRRPKVCLMDTGLAAALAGFASAKVAGVGGREYYGALVEQFVALELAKQSGWSATPFDLYHLRDLDGLEADLVVETDQNTLIAIEVKATSTPVAKHWRNLAALRRRLPERDFIGVLLHTGSFAARLHDWLHVLPITALWRHRAANLGAAQRRGGHRMESGV